VILVTGGTGFVGPKVVHALRAQERDVRCLVRKPGRAGTLRPNSAAIFKFGAAPGIVVRTADGDLRAFSAVCTHLDCTVQFKADTSELWCACHNGMYDLGGNVVSGPPPRGLQKFTVNLRGEGDDAEIVVTRT